MSKYLITPEIVGLFILATGTMAMMNIFLERIFGISTLNRIRAASLGNGRSLEWDLFLKKLIFTAYFLVCLLPFWATFLCLFRYGDDFALAFFVDILILCTVCLMNGIWFLLFVAAKRMRS